MRHSLNLLRILLELHPCYNTEENIAELADAMVDLEELRRLRILRGVVKTCPGCDGGSIWSAWESVVTKEDNNVNQ